MNTFEVGETYRVDTARKGIFSIKVTSQSDEWLDGEVVDGRAKAMLDYNVKEVGESVTLRKSFIRTATLQPNPESCA